jgi:serine protease Do
MECRRFHEFRHLWLVLVLSGAALLAAELFGARDGWAETGVGYQERWQSVAKAALPAVVSISATTKEAVSPQGKPPPFLPGTFAPSPPPEEGSGADQVSNNLGSGVLVAPEGYVLTAYHVITDVADIRATLADGRTVKADLIGADPMTDLALLKLPGRDFPTLPFGDATRVEVAEPVMAIGNPLGLGQTVTLGIVSAVGRRNLGLAVYEDFIQTDTAMTIGSSGGALLNRRGELLGITTAVASISGDYTGIGFAVPAKLVRMVFEHLRSFGRVRRGWLGVAVQELTPALAAGLGLPATHGLLVADVQPGSPATRAGLQRGDVLVQLGDTSVGDVGQFHNRIAQRAPDTRVALVTQRNGQQRTLEVTVGEDPGTTPVEEPAETALEKLGVMVMDLTFLEARELGLPPRTQGVVVTDTLSGAASQYASLQIGDVIQEINRQVVRSIDDVHRVLGQVSGPSLVLLVNRGGTTAYVLVERAG